MKTVSSLTILGILLVASVTDAFLFRKRSRPTIYRWKVDIDSDNSTSQKAMEIKDKAVLIFSYGKNMKEMNLTASSMMMEFSNPAGVMAIRLGPWWRGMCFLMPTTDTLNQVKTDIGTKNGTTVTLTDTVAFNGTSNFLSRDESKEVFRQHPLLWLYCGRSKVVETTLMNVGDADPDTKTLTFLGLDSRIDLMLRGKFDKGPKGPKRGPRGRKGPRIFGGLDF